MTEHIGGLELATLFTVVRLGDAAYGAAVRRAIGEQERRDYSVGAIYSTLQRLEDKGMLRSWSSEPLPERGGRARRYFAITRAGAAALRVAHARHQRMTRGLTILRGST